MNIVIAGYDFRESALAGSFRLRKLAEYLIEFGHAVTVVCAFIDENFEKKISAKGGICLRVVENEYLNYSLSMKIIIRLMYWPDPSAKWAAKVINNKKFNELIKCADLLVVSSPPHAIQKIGTYCKKKYGTPLVSDFRDDFLTNHRIKWRTPVHKLVAKRLECEVVELSNICILNTDEVLNRFSIRYPFFDKKFLVITNGYESSDYLSESNSVFELKTSAGRPKNIVYLGSIYDGFATNMISSISIQLTQNKLAERWSLHTAGPGDWSVANADENWTHYGLLSQVDSAKMMASADILLLLMPPGEREPSGTIPLKAYSYLASNRPIAYFGETGSTTRLLSSFDKAYIFSRAGINDFGSWLAQNEGDVVSSDINRSPEILKYDFINLIKQFEIVAEKIFENR